MFRWVFSEIMCRSHSVDYCSRLRLDRHDKSDYYQWSGMTFHCLNAFVYVLNIFREIDESPRQLGSFCNNRKNFFCLVGITIVTIILLYRIKIVTKFCVFWMLSCETGTIWRNFTLFLFFAGPDCIHLSLNAVFYPEQFRYFTKYGTNTHVVTKHDKMESRQSRCHAVQHAMIGCLFTVWCLSDRIW